MNLEKTNIPAAIIVAGVLIAGALFLKDMPQRGSTTSQSPAVRIGLNERKFQACLANGDNYKGKIQDQAESGSRAMEALAQEERGTPYNVIIDTKTGTKVQFAGAYPYDAFKQIIDQMISGKATGQTINLEPINEADHWYGNKDAQFVIVEYGDLECPYCAAVHPTIKKILETYDGKVAWVFRHYPLSIHQNAHIKAIASECAFEQGGDTAFFKYIDAMYDDLEAKINPKFDTSTL